MDNYPIVNMIEESIENEVSSLVGNNDVNLKTIIKIARIQDINPNAKEMEFKNLISQMRENNILQKFLIEKEYECTFDKDGNIIPLNIKDGERKET